MRPRVLLLDEPLGALDLKLRHQMQIELKHIQQEVGITFIYVTHDQEEALTMSDRLAVFNRGRIEQLGSPAEVYERPATGFVAGFVGVSNVLADDVAVAIAGDPHAFTIRPEKIAMVDLDAGVAEGRLHGNRARPRGRIPGCGHAVHRRARSGRDARGDGAEPRRRARWKRSRCADVPCAWCGAGRTTGWWTRRAARMEQTTWRRGSHEEGCATSRRDRGGEHGGRCV